MPCQHLMKKLFCLSLDESAPEALPHGRLSRHSLIPLLSKVQLCEVFIFRLYKVVILIFVYAAVVIEPGSASADACMKDSGHEDVHANEKLITDGLAAT
jgi:hypothetical protein